MEPATKTTTYCKKTRFFAYWQLKLMINAIQTDLWDRGQIYILQTKKVNRFILYWAYHSKLALNIEFLRERKYQIQAES